jgi:DtxR family Mn-dependent transcriptional regulator
MLSHAEENYVKAIYHLSDEGKQTVLTNALAEAMHTKAASVTDMLKKLAQKNLVEYEKYHGVQVTDKGRQAALGIIRKHRLWETFLVSKLGFKWDEVHDIAEQLEHIQSPLLIERLDAFLNYPQVDPHGDPIPDPQGKLRAVPRIALDEVPIGYEGTIVAVKNNEPPLLQYLERIGAMPGKRVKVLSREAFDESLEVAIERTQYFISREVSRNILVSA